MAWAFLQSEPDLPEGLSEKAIALIDRLAKETFFRELPDIDQAAATILGEYDQRFTAAVDARASAYQTALGNLKSNSAWGSLNKDQQDRIAGQIGRIGPQQGTERRLEIARCMITDPKLLLLDEPAAGLNPQETRELDELINELRANHGVSVLLKCSVDAIIA